MGEVTRIVSAIEQGELHASEELLPLVYDELRKLAAARMAQERGDHTLHPTALVHEAYLRLVGRARPKHSGDFRMVAFSGDAQVRTGTTVGTVTLWDVQRSPMQGDVDHIMLWLQVMTGFELDDQGAIHALDIDTWNQLRERLRKLGEPHVG